MANNNWAIRVEIEELNRQVQGYRRELLGVIRMGTWWFTMLAIIAAIFGVLMYSAGAHSEATRIMMEGIKQ